MSHRIELPGNLAIVQVATPKGKVFRLVENTGPTTSELLDEQSTAEEILLSAERFQQG